MSIADPQPQGLMLTPCDLRIDSQRTPLGIDNTLPLLSWRWVSERPGAAQTAYRIRVSSSSGNLRRGNADLWDSGRCASSECRVRYRGNALASRQRCFAEVLLWDADGSESTGGATTSWEMGLLHEEDWQGRWVGAKRRVSYWHEQPPAPLLRRVFCLPSQVKGARLSVCGLGYYCLSINGHPVGDEVLRPAFSQYDRTAYYQTFDVGGHLRQGTNVIGVVLGNGFYDCDARDKGLDNAPWRDQPKCLLELSVELINGNRERLGTDEAWRFREGPILVNRVFDGETYDARRECPGWDCPGYDDSDWGPVAILPPPGGRLRAQTHDPIRVVNTIQPVAVTERRPGVYIFDVGCNIAGWGRLRVHGEAGHKVKLRFAERLDEHGELDFTGILSSHPGVDTTNFQTDEYILRGGGEELWEPTFAYHGFQYIELSGYPGALSKDAVSARVVHTDLSRRGGFECSNELLNRIQSLTDRASLGNFHGLPTDCPHREKMGWLGDAWISVEQMLLNYEPSAVYRRWLSDIVDCQRQSGQLPGFAPTSGFGYNWGNGLAFESALIYIAWMLYMYTGDRSVLEEYYEPMRRSLAYFQRMSSGEIADFGLGDWSPPLGDGSSHRCPVAVSNTAIYHLDASIMAQVARTLGQTTDAARFGKLASRIRRAFTEHFVDIETGMVVGDTITSMASALFCGACEPEHRQRVGAALLREVERTGYTFDCGIFGGKFVLDALSAGGMTNAAYRMATGRSFPGYGFWLDQGATTLWENWDGRGSRNHHMRSHISAWFYQDIAGLRPDPDDVGFRTVIIKPGAPEGMAWARAWHDGPYGKIEVSWERRARSFHLEVSIPCGSRGRVTLPIRNPSRVSVNNSAHANAGPLDIGSGQHVIDAED